MNNKILPLEENFSEVVVEQRQPYKVLVRVATSSPQEPIWLKARWEGGIYEKYTKNQESKHRRV